LDLALEEQIKQFEEEIFSAIHEVDAAVEAAEDARQLAAGQLVRDLSQRYKALLGGVPDADQDTVERRIGRKLVDLRRSAMSLTRRDSGSAVAVAKDAGFVPFLEERAPPKAMEFDRTALRSTGISVGNEIESWCGKCKEMTGHRIVAVVDGEAKQVVCDVCASRHSHRASPPDKAKPKAPAPTSVAAGQLRNRDREQAKRDDARRALQNELAAAADPKMFDPKGRYKAGEIIEHPMHGRGKIENVTKGSLLVRFIDGLKPLNLF
jgi:hypothetical protein